jgi:hypothetical protein
LALFASLATPECLRAQNPPPPSGLPVPRLFTITPSGGKVGTTIEVTLTGQDIEGPQALLFSQPGIKAEPIVPPAPPPPAADAKKPADAKQPPPKPPAPPPITKFKVTIAAGTPLGIHDVRLVNKWGISNPRAFAVGDLTEVEEKEPNNDVPQAQRVELNCTINGAIAAPTDVDYFVFAGKKGQRVIVSCLASSIDSRLVAAVELYDSMGRQLGSSRHYYYTDALVDCTLPADGDYYVRVCQFTHTQGNAEHFYRLTISTAPWIDAIFPLAVEPGKTASVTVYGRNLPGGQPDPTAIQDGVVLEKLSATVTAPSDPLALQRLAYSGSVPPNASALDGFEFRLRNASGTSNPFLLTYARAPMVLEQDTHNTPETAQEVSLPCEISGRIDKRRDRDWYVFTAKKGEVYSIEVLSDRLGAPTDMYFLLHKPDTKQDVAEVDDNPDVLTPVRFYTRSDDPPVYRFAVPADGKYQLLVTSRDADMRAGPRHYYRVRITPEQPDFRLIVLPPDERRPDGCCLRQGGHEHYTVLVWRQEGFAGPIALGVEGLPKGVSCQPQLVAGNLRQAALVFTATADAPVWTGEIQVRGTATINGQTVVREARPATITWPVQQPQGIPAISRLDRSLVLAVREKAPFNLTVQVSRPPAGLDRFILLPTSGTLGTFLYLPVPADRDTRVVQGSKTNLAVNLRRIWPEFKTPLQVAPVDPQTHLPPGLTVGVNNQPLTIPPDKNVASAILEVKNNVPPGTYEVVLRGIAQMPYNKDPMAPQKPNINVVQPSAPLTITVLPSQVATLSVNAPNATLKIGAEAELVVKVTRMHNYAGEFKVQLVLPPEVKSVTADAVTIPAGKDEAKVILRAPADASPGNIQNLVVRATATIADNLPLVHEAKFNVNVVK